jgi:putative ATP-dependent endonuclease of the OLD family
MAWAAALPPGLRSRRRNPRTDLNAPSPRKRLAAAGSLQPCYWPNHPNELGVSFVGVGGSGNYLPFLRLAKQFRIPWVILSDGEANSVAAVDAALEKLAEPGAGTHPRVVILPQGQSFEAYVSTALPEYLDVVKAVIIDNRAVNDRHRQALEQEWSTKTADDTIAELKSAKTQYEARLAAGFCSLADPQLRVPEKIRCLLDLAFPPSLTAAVEPAGT